MKKRITLGSIAVILLIMIVPAINAVEVQTVERQECLLLYTIRDIKQMDSAELIVFIHDLAQDHPELVEEFDRCVQQLEEESVAAHSGLRQPLTDNQTFFEKIFWKIFNYRVFRLYISACLFLYFESDIMLLRTITWAIKLLRLTKIGMALGYIDLTPDQPQTPTIHFVQDNVTKTLIVASVSPEIVPWSDVDEIGAGSCDPLPTGTIMAGDSIANCTGILVLRYIPTDAVLGIFEFE